MAEAYVVLSAIMRGPAVTLAIFALVAPAAGQPGGVAIKRVAVDVEGQLRLFDDSGVETLAPKVRAQSGFADPKISPDGLTVGWLALYPDPSGSEAAAGIPGTLVLFRNGRVICKFPAAQIFWDWRFEDGGRRVAYSVGPTHGGAVECVLREVISGKFAARWPVKAGGAPPDWAKELRR